MSRTIAFISPRAPDTPQTPHSLVGGKSRETGSYGCLAARKGACENKVLVRRTLVERIIVETIQDQISNSDHIAYVLSRVEEEIKKLRSDLPETLKLKQAELDAEQRRLANFIDFVGEGRGSQALAKALVETERRVETLTEDVDALKKSHEKSFAPRRSSGSQTGWRSSSVSWSSARRSQRKR